MSDSLNVAAIDRVIELAPAKTLSVDEFIYLDKDKTLTMFKPPVPTALKLNTLSGFAALIDAGFEGFDAKDVVVGVEDFDTVHLIDKQSDKYGRRQIHLSAVWPKPERQFRFNQFMAQEEFNIAIMSMFVQDEQTAAVLAVTGNLAAKAEVRQQDDGITQEVTAKAGVVRVETLTVKPRVTLKPIRTFTEVEQPAGDFILRIKVGGDAAPVCALFEADAGAWKNTAMDTIATWLRNRLKGSAVTGIADIPVVS